MTNNAEVINVARTVIRYRMPKEVAERVVSRFNERARDGMSLSYLDCTVFDAALETLGRLKEYYGMTDEEYAAAEADIKEITRRYRVQWVDITDDSVLDGLLGS